MRSFTIRGRTITDASPSYVIAECSHNHQGSLDMAREMFRVAKECGADAVKLQKRSMGFYDALREKGLIEYANLREQRELNEDEYLDLRDYSRGLNLAFIVTAFDCESLEFVDGIGVDAIKLASGATHNPELLDAAAATGLPILLSTGCADLCDVEISMMGLGNKFAFNMGLGHKFAFDRVALLQCTSSYPTASADMHLRTLTEYRSLYPSTVVGLSSHHPANTIEPVAYALGARIFEKHFTLSRDLGPGDHANSLDPAGLRELVANLRAVEAAMGDRVKRFLPCEEEGRKRLDVTYNPNVNAKNKTAGATSQAMAV